MPKPGSPQKRRRPTGLPPQKPFHDPFLYGLAGHTEAENYGSGVGGRGKVPICSPIFIVCIFPLLLVSNKDISNL